MSLSIHLGWPRQWCVNQATMRSMCNYCHAWSSDWFILVDSQNLDMISRLSDMSCLSWSSMINPQVRSLRSRISWKKKNLPEMTCKIVKSAHVGLDNFVDFEVSLIMTGACTDLFTNITARNNILLDISLLIYHNWNILNHLLL